MGNLQTLKREYLFKIIKDKDFFLLDIRSSNSYNGWLFQSEKISGHIKNSINFHYKWLNKNSKLLNNILLENNIKSSSKIVLIHSNTEGLINFYNYFIKNNYKNLYSFDINNLHPIDAQYLEQYKNYKALVPPEFFNSDESKDFKIFHVGFGTEAETSLKGHIKGSLYINTDEIEPPPEWKLGDTLTLTKFAEKYALSIDDKIIVTAWNQMAAFRVATTLLYMGINDVRVLNGGLNSLEKEDYSFEKISNFIKPQNLFKEEIPKNKSVIISTNELKILLKEKNFTLVDNRTWLEHIGEISGYSYYKKKARIPGSVYGHAGFIGSQTLDYYRNPDDTMKSKESIEALWLSQNVPLDNHLAFMCGSGWRASEVYFYAYVLGYENISIYSDGWIGWSRDENNPTETGFPK